MKCAWGMHMPGATGEDVGPACLMQGKHLGKEEIGSWSCLRPRRNMSSAFNSSRNPSEPVLDVCSGCLVQLNRRNWAYSDVCQRCSFKLWGSDQCGTKIEMKNKVRCECMCSGEPCGRQPGCRYVTCVWCNSRVGVGCCAATEMACHKCTRERWGVFCCSNFNCLNGKFNMFKEWAKCVFKGSRWVWYLTYKGRSVEVPKDLILNISDMTAAYMVGNVDDLIWDEGANLISTLCKCVTYLSGTTTRRWDALEWISCHFHEIVAEYLSTPGGTFHLIDVAYRIYNRVRRTRDRVGPSLFRAMSDWEEETHASARILARMKEAGGLEDSASRELWSKSTHLGRDMCVKMANRLGGYQSRDKKRARCGSDHGDDEAELERRRNALQGYLARHGNGWPSYISVPENWSQDF